MSRLSERSKKLHKFLPWGTKVLIFKFVIHETWHDEANNYVLEKQISREKSRKDILNETDNILKESSGYHRHVRDEF